MRRMLVAMMVWVAGCVSGSGGGSSGSPATDAGLLDSGPARDAANVVEEPDAGCQTFSTLSTACGFNSDGRVCLMAVGCGLSDSDQACRTHCEGGARTHCYTTTTLTCMTDALSTQACPDLSACGVAF